jgi:serine/threonine protein kinase
MHSIARTAESLTFKPPAAAPRPTFCASRIMLPQMLIAGSKLRPYDIQASIGAGGMGEVYRARDVAKVRSSTSAICLVEQFLTGSTGSRPEEPAS